MSGDDETGMTVLVDPETIRRNGDLVKMWHLSNHQTMEGYGFIKSQREYGCVVARHRLLAVSIFSEPRGEGKVLSDNLKEDQWLAVPSNCRGQALWKFACSKK